MVVILDIGGLGIETHGPKHVSILINIPEFNKVQTLESIWYFQLGRSGYWGTILIPSREWWGYVDRSLNLEVPLKWRNSRTKKVMLCYELNCVTSSACVMIWTIFSRVSYSKNDRPYWTTKEEDRPYQTSKEVKYLKNGLSLIELCTRIPTWIWNWRI